jgi:hypothetical protein
MGVGNRDPRNPHDASLVAHDRHMIPQVARHMSVDEEVLEPLGLHLP